MTFTSDKTRAINNYIASKNVGDVDRPLIEILDYINNLDNYYTTSSCSGRITLYDGSGLKGKGRAKGIWHDVTDYTVILDQIKDSEYILWLKYEPPIFHIMAKTIKDGFEFLQIARDAGFKRGGLQSGKKERNILEIIGTQRLEAPVMDENQWLVDEEYVEYLVELSNQYIQTGHEKTRRLLASLKNNFNQAVI